LCASAAVDTAAALALASANTSLFDDMNKNVLI
jgi:hypothetical protein